MTLCCVTHDFTLPFGLQATPEVPEATVGGHDRDGPNEDDGGRAAVWASPFISRLICAKGTIESIEEIAKRTQTIVFWWCSEC